MTVREWFRVQRRSLWEKETSYTDHWLAVDLDRIANMVIDHQQAPEMLRIGAFYWIESVESFEERERVLALIRTDMHQALNRLWHTHGISE